MMNKGLEVIEAHWLFNIPAERIQVVIHPESVIHSLVQYADGSVIAELGNPDMRTPIAHALAWPRRLGSGVQFLDLIRVGVLDFRPPDPVRFRCLALAQEAAAAGGLAPAELNAANEVAVAAFLAGQVNFLDIAAVIDTVMQQNSGDGSMSASLTLDDINAADALARRRAHQAVAARARVS